MGKVKVVYNYDKEVKKVNTVINKFKDFTETIYYKESFDVRYGSEDYDFVDLATGEILKKRQRNFYYDGETLKPLHDSATVQKLLSSVRSSCRRANDNFYGYGFSNHWDYFCTFTVARNTYDFSDEETKKYWKMFRENLQKTHCRGVKILCVPERHTENEIYNIHFHALLGNCNLEDLLEPARNKKNGKLVKQNGRQVYNLALWDKGFSTIVKIDKGQSNQMQVANYLIKYTSKSTNIGYNQKKYYHTNNLDFKNKQLTLCALPELMDNVALDKSLIYKETDKMIVFRQFNKVI